MNHDIERRPAKLRMIILLGLTRCASKVRSFILNIKGMATKIVLSDLKERLILSTKYSVTDVSYQA
jgi:hypothetical protein